MHLPVDLVSFPHNAADDRLFIERLALSGKKIGGRPCQHLHAKWPVDPICCVSIQERDLPHLCDPRLFLQDLIHSCGVSSIKLHKLCDASSCFWSLYHIGGKIQRCDPLLGHLGQSCSCDKTLKWSGQCSGRNSLCSSLSSSCFSLLPSLGLDFLILVVFFWRDQMSKMEGPTEAPPSAGTKFSSKLVQFPESTWNNEEKKQAKPATSTRNHFLFNLLNCFGTFSSKPRERKEPGRAQRLPERKILRTPTLSTLSLSKMDSNIEASPYKWPHDSTFDTKTTALVIIDMQKDCEYCEFTFRAILIPLPPSSRVPKQFPTPHCSRLILSILSLYQFKYVH